jgi:hypothetical protein
MRALALVAVAIALAVRPAFGAFPDLSSATHGEAFRVAPLFDKHYRTSKRFRDSKLISGPRALSSSDLALAARELESIHAVEILSDCLFAPRYGFRFKVPAGTLDVLICPHCDEVRFIMDRPTDHVLRRCSMAERRSELMQMLKRLFPNHPLRDGEA